MNCRRFCFWRHQSVVSCVWNISGTDERICAKFTRKTGLVPRSDEFEGQRWRSQGQKWNFLALSVACVWFMFGKTSLTSSYLLDLPSVSVIHSYCLMTYYCYSGWPLGLKNWRYQGIGQLIEKSCWRKLFIANFTCWVFSRPLWSSNHQFKDVPAQRAQCIEANRKAVFSSEIFLKSDVHKIQL